MLSSGVRTVRENSTKQMTILSTITGLVLAAWYFVALNQQMHTPQWLPMMIAAIGGFEMFLFLQEQNARRGAGSR